MTFPTDLNSIWDRVDAIDPVKYGKTRNSVDGAVTYLSPYISRGVISTKQVFHHVMDKGYNPNAIEKFIQELAWRDYWQQIWLAKGNQINQDLRNSQEPVSNYSISKSIIEANTSIGAINMSIRELIKSGYMHNHYRMYLASIATNVAQSHWKVPATWMYYHLLDGDWASNTLSWQWVCGANSNKKYVANQDNINKYTGSKQKNTFLDVSYDSLPLTIIPNELIETIDPTLVTKLPENTPIFIDQQIPTYVYTSYNLDPEWANDIEANRILLLDPAHFDEYPKSDTFINFILSLSKNIKGIQVFVGSFNELKHIVGNSSIHYKEHPFSQHFEGIESPRDWMFNVKGDFRSFFAYWKKCKKDLKNLSFDFD